MTDQDSRLDAIIRENTASHETIIREMSAFHARFEQWQANHERSADERDRQIEAHGKRLGCLEQTKDRADTIYRFVAWAFGILVAGSGLVGAVKLFVGAIAK